MLDYALLNYNYNNLDYTSLDPKQQVGDKWETSGRQMSSGF